ncbi:MAG: NnrU family protein [Wenzhouxiangellaceae bacterium]
MTLLIIGLILFFATHSIRIVAEPLRAGMVARLGEWGYKGVYGLVALLGLVLIIIGYGQARLEPVLLYQPPAGLRHLNMLLMLFVFPALLAAYLPGRIQATLKHPMLVAVKLWALSHLLVNGTLADVLLFGGFLAWAVIDRISVKKRDSGPSVQLPQGKLNDLIVIVGGLALYVAFAFWLHPILIGVPAVG